MANKKDILVVEDDPNSRLVVKTILNKAGYKVIEAEDGKEAIKILKEDNAPDLVICDWMMPDVDGMEVLKSVRNQNQVTYTYFIFLTAKIQTEDLAAGFNQGADDYLTKPFNKTELLARVHSGLRILELHNNLIAKSETIKDFAYALTHDLKTPLLALNMTMQQARDGIYGDLPEKYKTLVPKSIDTVKLLLDMCESLLSIARYDQGNLKLDKEKTNLNNLLLDCCESVDPLVKAKQLSLEITQAKSAGNAMVDPKEISRLVLNLLSNAIKYTPAKGSIKAGIEEKDETIILYVSDSGPGIPEDELDTIFERFHKNKHGRRTIGTGLGLYLCKLITELHQGKIGYEISELGGSKFVVSLPKASESK